MNHEQITVPGKLESLNAIAGLIITTAQLTPLDSKTTYKLRLAVDDFQYERVGQCNRHNFKVSQD